MLTPSKIPAAETDYKAPEGMLLDPQTWDAVFASVAARLRTLEGWELDYQGTVDLLKAQALQVISATITEEVNAQRANLEAVAEQTADLEAYITNLIQNGGLADAIQFRNPIPDLAAANVDAAIREVLAKIVSAQTQLTALDNIVPPAPALADALKFLRWNAAGTAFEAAALDVTPSIARVARTSNTGLAKADQGKFFDVAGLFTQTFVASSTLGAGWYCWLRNSGGDDIYLDPNASELIDGFTGFALYPGEIRLVLCDGTALRTFMLKPGVKVYTGAGSFTVPPGATTVHVQCIGGGGGGGAPTGASYGAGGGGGGGCSETILQAFPGNSYNVTVGAGGQGGYSAGMNGGDGGNSTFGSLIGATGGQGGFANGANNGGGKGGNGSLDTVPFPTSSQQVLAAAGVSGALSGNGTYAQGSTGGYAEFGGGGGGCVNPGNGEGSDGGSSLKGGGGGGGGSGYSNQGNFSVFYAGAGGNSGTRKPADSGAKTTSGQSGQAGYSPGLGLAGSGGAGGATSNSQPGKNGGNGGFPGGGGGGGSATQTAPQSGSGGTGGAGRVIVRWW